VTSTIHCCWHSNTVGGEFFVADKRQTADSAKPPPAKVASSKRITAKGCATVERRTRARARARYFFVALPSQTSFVTKTSRRGHRDINRPRVQHCEYVNANSPRDAVATERVMPGEIASLTSDEIGLRVKSLHDRANERSLPSSFVRSDSSSVAAMRPGLRARHVADNRILEEAKLASSCWGIGATAPVRAPGSRARLYNA